MKLRTFLVGCGALEAMLAGAFPARAQTPAPIVPFNIGDAVRESEQSRRPPLPAPAAAPVLPQLVEPQFTMKDKETLFVRSIEIEGPDLGAGAEARELIAPYENRTLQLGEIYGLADQLTTLYRTKGYLVAKAYIPAQDARSGALRIKLVPGLYGTITIKNDSLVRDDYLRGVIDQALAGSPVIQKDPLERAMLLISDLPGAGMPRVAIGPGQQPETSDFVFSAPEARRLDGYLLGDNFGSPFTGRDRLSGGLNLNSPLGYGDRLSAFGIVSERAGLVNGRASYSFPIFYDGLRAEIGAFRTTYALSGVYEGLDATGTADAVTATLTYAMRRQHDDSIYISGNYSHMSLNDKALGVSFAQRTIDLGTAAITRDTFSDFIGLPLTTSTTFSFTAGYVNFPDPKQEVANIATIDTAGNYAKINLSFIATLALAERLSLSANVRGQKSLSGNLDSSQQMSLTGYWGVRSYDEGLSGDSGYLVTPELKYALPDIYGYRHAVGLFTDVGAAWLENGSYTLAQKSYTQLNDFGLSYNATYEYSPGRFLLAKALVAHTYGSDFGAKSYDRTTKGLVQVGFTF
ncbi:Polypeptide-transport-associated domain protein ShlB-type [Methylocella silvestris BL2]|uniref:Polypeptide-transport-associated domain protein ShlB-type n=1 Tax=Methylocella silvestris (strain DSM 15510 / CIP 108128 / LMG 27833 / NCIMB 13906 / BL2) TaxID=395965 RepID=B8EQ97_METSB|nr:ShlB/FhaC/HecB family hemolysin secretion/activation protein [Methylocella silvestris]ACK51587.1 Polypeptide-transport-associated domain protein ShlB-type [Methylocella silvestris BL2]